jgi:hypothetical protein
MADIDYGFSQDVYVAALKVELSLATDKERKAAITAELDKFEKRTAVAPKKETA